MRVCIPIAGNPSSPRPSGILSFAIGLGKFLADHDIPVEFLSAGGRGDGRNIRITPIASTDCHEIEFSRALSAHLRRTKVGADTVFVVNSELYAWSFRRTQIRAPIVMVLHGPTYPTLKIRRPLAAAAFRRVVEPGAYSLVHSVIAIDDESLEYVASRYPTTPAKKIPLPIDTEHYRPTSRRDSKVEWGIHDRPAMLFVGRLSIEKNPELAVGVCDQMQSSQPDAVLIMAGDGPLLKRLKAEQESRGTDYVRLIGAVSRSRLPSLYSAADAVLIPSMVEQLPNVLLESLACGTQVISTDVGDIRKVIDDPCLGALVAPRAPAFAQAMLGRFPENEDARAKYVPIRRAAAARYSWSQLGPRFLEEFNASLPS